MLTYFAVFCALAICVGWFVVSIHEWLQGLLYGPYAGSGQYFAKGQWKSDEASKAIAAPNKTAVKHMARAVKGQSEI